MNFDAIKPLILPILIALVRHGLVAIGYDNTDSQNVAIDVAGWIAAGGGLLWSIADKVKIQKLKKQVAETKPQTDK